MSLMFRSGRLNVHRGTSGEGGGRAKSEARGGGRYSHILIFHSFTFPLSPLSRSFKLSPLQGVRVKVEPDIVVLLLLSLLLLLSFLLKGDFLRTHCVV